MLHKIPTDHSPLKLELGTSSWLSWLGRRPNRSPGTKHTRHT